MIIAQLSDFHVTPEGVFAYGAVDTRQWLRRAIEALGALSEPPALVIGTGDLVQSGGEDEYRELNRILIDAPAPFVPVMGNHDDRLRFRRAFAKITNRAGPHPFVQYYTDVDGLRIVILDTITEGRDDASFCQQRSDWLTHVLSTAPGPALIAMHHPPFPIGIDWIDPPDPYWADAIGDAVEQSGKVVKIICGHVHRSVHKTWRGVSVSIAPSTAHQLALDFRAGAAPMLSHEAPGFLIHRFANGEVSTFGVSTLGLKDTFSPSPQKERHPST